MTRSRRILLGLSALSEWVWIALVVWFVLAPGRAYHFFAGRWPLAIVLAVAAGWGGRRLFPKLLAYARVLPKAKRNRTDLLRYVGYRPTVLGAVGAYETAVLVNSQVDTRLKSLAGIKASSMVGCPF
jgi:hypothetical protein